MTKKAGSLKSQAKKGKKRKHSSITETAQPLPNNDPIDPGAFKAMLMDDCEAGSVDGVTGRMNDKDSSQPRADPSLESEDILDTGIIPKKKRNTKRCLPSVPDLDMKNFATLLPENLPNIQEKNVQNTAKDFTEPNKVEKKKPRKKRAVKEAAVEKDEEEKSHRRDECLQYLDTWKSDKINWKFNKRLQVWLLKNLYDENAISDQHFSVLLEYLQGAKGAAKTTTIKTAEAYFSENDEQSDANKQKLKRAREIVQFLSE